MQSKAAPPKGRTINTEYDKQMVDAAMERVGGNTAHAAAALGWPVERLRILVRSDARLAAKWKRGAEERIPDGPASEVDRPDPVMPFSRAEIEASAALSRQDNRLQSGWKKLGLNEEQQSFLVNLQATYAGAAADVIQLTGAGVAHTYTRLLFTFEEIIKKMKHVDDHPEEYKRMAYSKTGDLYEVKGPHEFWCELQDRLVAVASEMRKVTSDVQRIQLIRAQIEKIAADHAKNVTRKRQGWDGGPPPGAAPAAIPTTVSPTVDVL